MDLREVIGGSCFERRHSMFCMHADGFASAASPLTFPLGSFIPSRASIYKQNSRLGGRTGVLLFHPIRSRARLLGVLYTAAPSLSSL